MYAYQKIAKILRTDKDIIAAIDSRLGELTGKKNIMDKIVEENDSIIKNRIERLGLSDSRGAKEIYDSLIEKTGRDNELLFKSLGNPSTSSVDDWNRVLSIAKKLAGDKKGFFLKTEKAVEFLRNCPPKNVLNLLSYDSIDEMLGKEDVFEIYGSLRFIESSEWLNSVFFKQYENLSPEDFEYREITTRVFPQKWAVLAQDFIRKKYHNISHLKELGVIFVIPLSLDASGELIRNFSLIFHYFNEISFYSSLFEKFSKKPEFSNNAISLLRGDVIDKRDADSQKIKWLVVQRYLAKDDENDWRLFVPHVNPEALHWEKAERMLVKTGQTLDHFAGDMSFWQNLGWVGDYFKSDAGIDVLVSFNLVDTAMSLVKSKDLIKYLYHHQESLWNKIFIEFFGADKMEEFMQESIIKGWFEV